MLYIPASMAFMVQSSCIVFAALSSVLVLRRRLNRLHIEGIIAALVGVAVVTVAGVLYSDDEQSSEAHDAELTQRALVAMAAPGGRTAAAVAKKLYAKRRIFGGIGLTLAGAGAQALQFVSEERLLGRSKLPPTHVIGLEGLLSSLFSIIALIMASFIPGPSNGVQESWPDTMAQLRNSVPLQLIIFANYVGIATTNIFGLRGSSLDFLLC